MTLTELNLHRDMVTQLAEAEDSLRSMRESVMKAQSYDAMPHGTGVSDKVGKLAVMIVQQEEDVKRLQKAVDRSEVGIKKYIEGIKDNRTKMIFRLRFLCGYEWQSVADVLGSWNSEDSVKSICYRYLNTANDGR